MVDSNKNKRSGGPRPIRKAGGPISVSDALVGFVGLDTPIGVDIDKLRTDLESEIAQHGAVPFGYRTSQQAENDDARLAARRRYASDNPDSADAQLGLASALVAAGLNGEAVEVYRRALALGADPMSTEFQLATLGEGDMPATPPEAYVARVFDAYSDHFDEHLVGKLRYHVPVVMREMVESELDPAPRSLRIIDAGCGTGLVGAELKPFARRLEGVDLSGRMIAKARRRRIYERLARGELHEALRRREGWWDLVTAADVLIYIGDCAPIFAASRDALVPGGYFLYSVELLQDGRDVALQPTGRYQQSAHYLARLAEEMGFSLLASRETYIRYQADRPVPGLVHLLRRD